MRLSVKIGLYACLISRFIFWIGGNDIFERSYANAFSIALSIFIGLALWGLCMAGDIDDDL